jgi:hypothetical protein
MTEDIRYDLTVKARQIARSKYARKSIAEERAKHYIELVREPEFLDYIKGLTQQPEQQTSGQIDFSSLEPQQTVPTTTTPTTAEPTAPNVSGFGHVDFDQYKPFQWGTYTELNDEREKLLEQFHQPNPYPYLIEGDKGLGKTLCVYDVAFAEKIHLVFHACSSGTRVGDLLGRLQVNENGSYFDLGVLPRAILCANKYKKACLYLDEINALEPEVQKILNPVCDDRRMITANSKQFRLNEGCTLVVIASMNPSYYAGVNQLTEDMRSRFIGDVWSYPSSSELKSLVDWKGIPMATVGDPLVQLVQDTHSSRVKGDVEYVLSPRDVVQFTDIYRMWSHTCDETETLKRAIHTCLLVKYGDSTEREFVKTSAQDTFDVTL